VTKGCWGSLLTVLVFLTYYAERQSSGRRFCQGADQTIKAVIDHLELDISKGQIPRTASSGTYRLVWALYLSVVTLYRPRNEIGLAHMRGRTHVLFFQNS
jgi:hypothetical protein